jgi:hypothetical protein
VSELNIVELLNQEVLKFGNERFLKGWNGQQERIIKLLENETLETTPENHRAEYDKLVWAGIREQLIALIKGENK